MRRQLAAANDRKMAAGGGKWRQMTVSWHGLTAKDAAANDRKMAAGGGKWRQMTVSWHSLAAKDEAKDTQ